MHCWIYLISQQQAQTDANITASQQNGNKGKEHAQAGPSTEKRKASKMHNGQGKKKANK